MNRCCDDDATLDALQRGQRGTLLAVLAINALMFLVMAGAALYGDSSALLADSLDNLGDALTYGLSLYAVSRGARTKARVALFKGALILAGAVAVGVQVVWRLVVPATPLFELMGAFGLLALLANGLCLTLLSRHAGDDVNMRSVWECARNDIAANLSVLVAAGAVWATGTGWPDLLVACGLMLLLLRSAMRVLADARAELHAADRT